jgi:hypothetical protein
MSKMETYTVHTGITGLLKGQMVAGQTLNLMIYRWQTRTQAELDLSTKNNPCWIRVSQNWIAETIGATRSAVGRAISEVLIDQRGYIASYSRRVRLDLCSPFVVRQLGSRTPVLS